MKQASIRTVNVPRGQRVAPAPGDFQSQLNALKAQVAALQQQVATRAPVPNVGDLSIGFEDPPSRQNLEDLQDYIESLVNAL